jgi:putative ABC transport system ATP-binding protein
VASALARWKHVTTLTQATVLHLAGYRFATARARAIDLLNYLEVGHRRNAMPAQLSGG